MIRVLGNRVLVALPPKVHKQEDSIGFTYQPKGVTETGIILAGESDAADIIIATRGIVVQLGQQDQRVDLDDVRAAFDSVYCETGADIGDAMRAVLALAPAPFDVEVGDCVVFAPSTGDTLSLDGIDYLILRESDILGIVEPTGKEREWLQRLHASVDTALKTEGVCV